MRQRTCTDRDAVPSHFLGQCNYDSQAWNLPSRIIVHRAKVGGQAVRVITDMVGMGHCEAVGRLDAVKNGGQRIDYTNATVDKTRSDGMRHDMKAGRLCTASSECGVHHLNDPSQGKGYHYAHWAHRPADTYTDRSPRLGTTGRSPQPPCLRGPVDRRRSPAWTDYLKGVRGYPPGPAATALLPMAGAAVIASTQVAARLWHRLAPRSLIVPGLLLTAVGLAVLTGIDAAARTPPRHGAGGRWAAGPPGSQAVTKPACRTNDQP
ncbi:hypothetical protein [Streptomyces gelaticus]|nr:hypothetical protein [Streptomyces gelaticus]